jgi:hypothetical protein
MGCNCKNDNQKLTFANVKQVIKEKLGIIQNESIEHNILKPYASDDIQEERLSICKTCEFYTSILNKDRCTISNSFLKAKVSLIDQYCPHPEEKKW